MLEYAILTTEHEKNNLKDEFFSFFLEVYSKPLCENAWRHQFINSPYKDSPLFVAKYDGKLVGCALMIKQKMQLDCEVIDYFLFTTSAILENFRNLGIYAELLKMQKKYALNQHVAFIFAFPNKLAYPVLKLFGRFRDLKKVHLGNINVQNISFDKIKNSFLIDDSIINWRFEHNNYRFFQYKDYVLIVKKFELGIDLLAIYPKSVFRKSSIQLDELSENLSVFGDLSYVAETDNIIAKNTLNATYFITDNNFDEAFFLENVSVNLLMSDVF